MRFKQVTFGVSCSPFLNATVHCHLKYYPQLEFAVVELQDKMYVHDWLSGADSDEEAISLFEGARTIMAEASFTLTKWVSSIPEAMASMELQGALVGKTEVTTVLGVKWLLQEDVFTYDILLLL